MEKGLQNLPKSELIPLLLEANKEVEKLQHTHQDLQHVYSTLQKENQSVQAKNKKLEIEVEHFKLKNQLLARLLYGQKRERFETSDLPQLPFTEQPQEAEQRKEETVEKITYERKKPRPNHPGRKPLPEHLPVEEKVIEPEGDLTDMVKIGEETTDVLEYEPAKFYITRYIRPKYARKDKETVVIAKLPSRTFDKCIAGNSLLTSIVVDKYVDHLPLYRQMQRFKREKIIISPATVDGWVKRVVDLLKILYEHKQKEIKAKGYLQADETTIKVLDRNKKKRCHLGYYWAYRSPMDGSVLFNYQPGRSEHAARQMLDGFKGYLQTDGYNVYENIAKSKDVVHLCCWAHARREFERALPNDKDRASMALTFIQSLYKVEAKAKKEKLSSGRRKALRLDNSLPILNAFGKWLTDEIKSGKVLPKSAIGKAIAYTLNRWEQLNNYLKDGMLEIDNNLIENAIRPIAIGRKNYLFAGSDEGAKRAAIVYSFFAMCKIEGVNPAQWLKYVLDNIQDAKVGDLDKFYPGNFSKNQSL